MEFLVSYRDFSLPIFMNNTLSFLGLIRELLFVTLFHYSGFEAFLDPDICWPPRLETRHDMALPSLVAVLTKERLPVVKYSEIVDPPESCAVCLHEFYDSEETRKLAHCRHVFHRKCVDGWIDREHKTCPLCRTPFVTDDMQEAFDEKVWTASGLISGFY